MHTRYRPLGDILLRSWHLGAALTAVQSTPTVIDSKGADHFLPGLRLAGANGNLVVGWYERASGSTAETSYVAAVSLSPTATSPSKEVTITTASSNWLGVTSNLVPNFGDYTDVYVVVSSQVTAYFAWSDGRSGDPQPFNSRMTLSG